MNISEVGQLFMTGISSLALTDEERDFIRGANIGGIILFSKNFNDPAQLLELTADLQTLNEDLALFISVDQEGGRVKRFKTHFVQAPSMLEVGSIDSPKLTFELHKMMGDELAACGINLDFSPCCDVWSNPKNSVIGDRAFGTSVEQVEKHVSAAIRGLHASNVLACAKHFPGHGDTLKDSHFDLPYVVRDLEALKTLELPPFIKAVKSRVEFMMMAHLVVDAIDPKLPCTLSSNAYEFCREYLKYKKIIITDDMEMQAITNDYGYEDAAVMALKAGADILLYRSMESCRKAYNGVIESIKKGEMKLSNMEEKLARIKACKRTHLTRQKKLSMLDLPDIFDRKKQESILEQFKHRPV